MRAQISLILVTFSIMSLSWCSKLFFIRNISCLQTAVVAKQQICSRWNQTTQMYYFADYFHLCFPEGTLLVTPNGPVQIQQLNLGDQVLSFNAQKNRNEFSEIKSWISRDPFGLSSFTLIRTRQQLYFIASPSHNVATIKQKDSQEQIDYKLASELKKGDRLMGSNKSEIFQVQFISEIEELMGLYSPLTANSNFYIVAHQRQQEQRVKIIYSQPMILVHCYSQIRNPTNYEYFFTPFLFYSAKFLGQIDREQPYYHSAYSLITYIIGNNWVPQTKSVKYKFSSEITENSGVFSINNFYGLEKGGGGGGKGGGSRGSSSFHSSSASNSNNRNRLKKNTVGFFCLLSSMNKVVLQI